MDNLPPELLHQICGYLVPGISSLPQGTSAEHLSVQALAHFAQVSRKYYQISIPYLYDTIPVTLVKSMGHLSISMRSCNVWDGEHYQQTFGFELPTTRGCNCGALIRTLRRRPDLAKYVKTLIVKRHDMGFQARWHLGLYGTETWWQQQISNPAELCIPNQRRYSRQTHLSVTPEATEVLYEWGLSQIGRSNMNRGRLAHEFAATIDPIYTLFYDMLMCIPTLEYLDLSLYITDAPRKPWLDIATAATTGNGILQTLGNLDKIRSMVVNLNTQAITELRPLFSLPVLKTLRVIFPLLRSDIAGPNHAWKASEWERVANRSPIQNLSLINIVPNYMQPFHRFTALEELDTNPLRLISQSCKALCTLHIQGECTTTPFREFLTSFAKHYSTLHTITVYSPHPTRAQTPAFPDPQVTDSTHRTAIILPP
ncbi:hypothetical protein P154DRAFT_583551 [Amniculicola lignicola CBS 123094]|uniref:Uncharacterized protein n=1 Tax=Amniculicola lignicola CBS 123094 TaxID=1392246 RepID=A0A6A5VVI5_9PLEO|nr:hypothetical protein P154DRAFT_583551 [Amniculicola lignicola CBS 123094]